MYTDAYSHPNPKSNNSEQNFVLKLKHSTYYNEKKKKHMSAV